MSTCRTIMVETCTYLFSPASRFHIRVFHDQVSDRVITCYLVTFIVVTYSYSVMLAHHFRYDNVPMKINRLRCRVNYHALKFLPGISQTRLFLLLNGSSSLI